MTKRIKTNQSKNHLGNMKMNFLAAMVSGVDKHLTSPKGSIMFSRLNNEKKNDQFRNHILDEFAKRSANSLENIEHEKVLSVAELFQKKYLNAATRNVNKIAKQEENFNHQELLLNTFASFEKVHTQLLNKL